MPLKKTLCVFKMLVNLCRQFRMDMVDLVDTLDLLVNKSKKNAFIRGTNMGVKQQIFTRQTELLSLPQFLSVAQCT
jgi:hypothetical protein